VLLGWRVSGSKMCIFYWLYELGCNLDVGWAANGSYGFEVVCYLWLVRGRIVGLPLSSTMGGVGHKWPHTLYFSNL
jgi:hypothetical protein